MYKLQKGKLKRKLVEFWRISEILLIVFDVSNNGCNIDFFTICIFYRSIIYKTDFQQFQCVEGYT